MFQLLIIQSILTFNFFPAKHWFDLDNRRNILLQFAKQSGFDPLIPDHWYTASAEKFRKMKVQRWAFIFFLLILLSYI